MEFGAIVSFSSHTQPLRHGAENGAVDGRHRQRREGVWDSVNKTMDSEVKNDQGEKRGGSKSIKEK